MSASQTARYDIGEAFGVEIEYMIVDAETLDVRPCADVLLTACKGDAPKNDVVSGNFRWSNELALHVIEIKTNGPVTSLGGLAEGFQQQVGEINRRLSKSGCRLLPTGMHPWMNPATETHLWPHAWSDMYQAFDDVFGCHGHGWSNLQSTHLNLPFRGDASFRRLHSALRLVLPLLPALSASSPACDRRLGGSLDMRLEHYGANAAKLPCVTGLVVPDVATSEAHYRASIYAPIAQALAPLDPQGQLEATWVNARGIIPRFDRSTIELRILDTQENPTADLAVLSFIHFLVTKALEAPLDLVETPDTASLAELYRAVVRVGRGAALSGNAGTVLAGALGVSESAKVGQLLARAFETWPAQTSAEGQHIAAILQRGSLSERIRTRLATTQNDLRPTYADLADCLAKGKPFG